MERERERNKQKKGGWNSEVLLSDAEGGEFLLDAGEVGGVGVPVGGGPAGGGCFVVDAVPDDAVVAAGGHGAADGEEDALLPGELEEADDLAALGVVGEEALARGAGVRDAGVGVLGPLRAVGEVVADDDRAAARVARERAAARGHAHGARRLRAREQARDGLAHGAAQRAPAHARRDARLVEEVPALGQLHHRLLLCVPIGTLVVVVVHVVIVITIIIRVVVAEGAQADGAVVVVLVGDALGVRDARPQRGGRALARVRGAPRGRLVALGRGRAGRRARDRAVGGGVPRGVARRAQVVVAVARRRAAGRAQVVVEGPRAAGGRCARGRAVGRGVPRGVARRAQVEVAVPRRCAARRTQVVSERARRRRCPCLLPARKKAKHGFRLPFETFTPSLTLNNFVCFFSSFFVCFSPTFSVPLKTHQGGCEVQCFC